MALILVNLFRAFLGVQAEIEDTDIYVQDGQLSPLPDALAAGEYLHVITEDADGNVEIMRVTAIDKLTNKLTVTRAAEEGARFPARQWPAGTRVEARLTKADLGVWEAAAKAVSAPTEDGVSGITERRAAGESMTKGTPCYVASTGKCLKADRSNAAKMPAALLCAEDLDADEEGEFLRQGYMYKTGWSWTQGADLCVGATAGTLSESVPANGSTDDTQFVGTAVAAALVWFAPNAVNLLDNVSGPANARERLGAEAADADILKADVHGVLSTAFESNLKASNVSGNVTISLTQDSDSNYIKLTLTGNTQLNGLTKTSGKASGAIIEVVPGGHTLSFNSTYFKPLKGSESPSTSKKMFISLYSGAEDYAWYMILLEP